MWMIICGVVGHVRTTLALDHDGGGGQERAVHCVQLNSSPTCKLIINIGSGSRIMMGSIESDALSGRATIHYWPSAHIPTLVLATAMATALIILHLIRCVVRAPGLVIRPWFNISPGSERRRPCCLHEMDCEHPLDWRQTIKRTPFCRCQLDHYRLPSCRARFEPIIGLLWPVSGEQWPGQSGGDGDQQCSMLAIIIIQFNCTGRRVDACLLCSIDLLWLDGRT